MFFIYFPKVDWIVGDDFNVFVEYSALAWELRETRERIQELEVAVKTKDTFINHIKATQLKKKAVRNRHYNGRIERVC